MATVVQDLVTKFSFVGSDEPIKEFNLSLGGSIKLLAGMFAGLNAAAGAFSYWADGVLTGVDSLDRLSKVSDVAVSRIQELNYVAEQSQSSAEAMQSTISSLSSVIGSAAQKGSEDFARLGISVRDANGQVKNADAILDEVRGRFGALNLTMQEQETFASSLGIDSSLIQLLNRTDSEMSSLTDRARELGTLTAEQTEQANLYKKSLNSMWFGLNSVKQLIAVGVAPELSSLAESFTQLLADNKDWIVNGIQFTVKWIGNLFDAFARLAPFLAAAAVGFAAAKVAALGFATVMGIIFSPLIVGAALIAGLLLAVDDLIVAFSGGNSVIGNFFKDTFDIDIVKSITDAFVFLRTYAIDPLVDKFKLLWGYWQSLPDGIVSGGAAIANFLGFGGENIPIGTGTGPGGGNTSNRIDQKVNIEIKTNDPISAGRAVQDSLQRQLDNANAQIGIGGR